MKAELSGASMLFVIAGSAMAAFTGESPFLTGSIGGATQPTSERVGFVVPIPITGVDSVGGLGSAFNDSLSSPTNFASFPPGTSITGIGWDVHLTAYAPSLLSHMTVRVSPTPATGLFIDLTPGAGSNFSGGPIHFTSGGIVKFANYNLPDLLLPTGNLYLEFYELVDDYFGNTPDGDWNSTLFIQYIPAPAAVGLLGLAGLRCVARKRRPI